MSGSAALSAARKRRASNAPMASNGAPPSYYNRGQNPNGIPAPIAGPGINAGPSFGNEQSRFVQPFPPQPMNIYENIELIKLQLAERTKMIQTQGSSIPPDKIKILHKQNEIQTQILKQKIAIAKQMESLQQESPNVYDHNGFAPSVSGQTIPEPEFIYERGVPQRNPKYKGAGMGTGGMSSPNVGMQKSNSGGLQVTPFVTMISDTGVIPPPIVIIKSHDVKLEEHNYVLHEVVQQLSELQAKVNRFGSGSFSSADQQQQAPAKMSSKENKLRHDEQYQNEDHEDEDEEEEDEEELLMDVVMNDLTNSREFVEGIVTKIVTETNLSEVIMKIEPLVKENQELRTLIHSQQQMMNEMNTMLLRLLNQGNTPTKPETYQDNGLDSDGLYQTETTEIILSHSDNKKVEMTDNNSETSPTFPSLQVTQDDSTNHIHIDSGVVKIDISDDSLVAELNDNNNQSNEKNEDEPASEPASEPSGEPENIEFTSAPIDDYSSPHFPSDPISLIVNEIQ
jgi:hypothetical protein